jgi:hypothetical protein
MDECILVMAFPLLSTLAALGVEDECVGFVLTMFEEEQGGQSLIESA